ncbi:MAG: DNA gyrase/topoisomerase IV subunit A [Marinilabiliaceae bacterium]|nr:DNA gyrase/topoisomerase IV subunit A [Marinilabiliaceae bacterium]
MSDIDNLDQDLSEELENEGHGIVREDGIRPVWDVDETRITHLPGMYRGWFLDYASYVILERAVPHINDGLKPVQRRILHAMRRMDDGRYNKVANIIGSTMMFHPHGDASIGDALVQLGQKGLLIDPQGNWGNVFTGDGAAAPRYIEARLTKFAQEVVFNPKTTEWKLSYDGRNQEPVTLPVKFPLLLAQGVEGIAVGLASKILPHNFNELIDASIAHLKDEDFELFPDFPTGGYVDVTRYNDGHRGGSVRVRAKISKLDSKTLVISDIPYGKNTGSLIESIIKANDKQKIKVKKIDDNTAGSVEILVHLPPGSSPDKTIDALYAFTDCEISISPNCCVISDNKPHFMYVSDVLKSNTEYSKHLLMRELDIRMNELENDWHYSSLEKIFFEERIYRELEKDTDTWEQVLDAIDKGFDPFRSRLRREIVPDDIVKLTEKPVRKISKFDIKKADEHIKAIEDEMEQVKFNIEHIIDYTIDYYKRIKKNYGKDFIRMTEIRSFENIEASKVVVKSEKLYINREDGFVGTSLKKDEYICDCSDIDDIIIIYKDGRYIISKVQEKTFVGKNIIHLAIFKKNDKRTIYNVVYRDGKKGNVYVKRFAITGITRDKEYNITQGTDGSEIVYFSANPNGEAELLKVMLKPKPRIRNIVFDFDMATLAIKGRNSMGNILTKNDLHKVVLKQQGLSTLGGRKIYFEFEVLRLNADGRGIYLGEFQEDDQILVINKDGEFFTTNFDLANHYDDNILVIEKFRNDRVWSAVFFDGEQKYYYIKRFQAEVSVKPQNIIGEHKNSKLVLVTKVGHPIINVKLGGDDKFRDDLVIDVAEFIGVKGFKARGKRLTTYQVGKISELEPTIPDEPEVIDNENIEPGNRVDTGTSEEENQMSLF